MKKYDIFISYRRKETADKAEHLFTLLENEGYIGRVSFDRENLDGRFDIEILKRLDNCKDFIVILAPDTLSYLQREETGWYHRLAYCTIEEFPHIEMEMKAAAGTLDFVRLEIARALAKGKHIIPVVPINSLTYNFDNLRLTDDICLLTKQHAERYQDTKDFLFKDILPRIIKRLNSRPTKFLLAKYVVTVLLSVVLIGCIGGWIKWDEEKNRFKNCRTQADYESFAQNTYFFRSECEDSLYCFKELTKNKVPINDAKNTGSNDSIWVDWGKNCSLKQLRTLHDVINNMMYVEAGTFIMGAKNPIGLEDFEHQITIENDFYIGKFEVTEREWNVIMKDSIVGSAKLPMTMVSWNDCDKFRHKLRALTGLVFELPTESQWEYAAKKNGEKDWIYAGSNTPTDVANYIESSKNGTIEEIDSRRPNALELYDMSGNVAEWCSNGDDKRKRIRGGSFMSSIEEIAVTYSDVASVDTKSKAIGLRLLLKH
ncbi:MAG: SUMF1/EgtB/PvdO family nonheme iron enzyme [Muribaculaceae bacterium]|nr:SUMF1/EgtB/PvdO family nonheme iron enzyme [Muribaculaceae bacterium]